MRRCNLTTAARRCVLPGIALLAVVVAWSAHRSGRAPFAADARQAAPPPAAAAQGSAADPVLVAAVAADVERRNREAQKDREAFQQAGWTFTETAPPDPALVDFDPALLDRGREAELRMQLLSAAAPPEHAGRVLVIAEHAKDPATRVAAAEALARMGAEGQTALADLVAGGKLAPDDPARAVAIASTGAPR